jgi:hypothetical protein
VDAGTILCVTLFDRMQIMNQTVRFAIHGQITAICRMITMLGGKSFSHNKSLRKNAICLCITPLLFGNIR